MHPLALLGSMIGGIIFGSIGQSIGNVLDDKKKLTKVDGDDTVAPDAQTVPTTTKPDAPTVDAPTKEEIEQ